MIFTINGMPSDLTRYDNLLDVDSHLNPKKRVVKQQDSHLNPKKKRVVKQQDDTLD
jgi:hypothetical protein